MACFKVSYWHLRGWREEIHEKSELTLAGVWTKIHIHLGMKQQCQPPCHVVWSVEWLKSDGAVHVFIHILNSKVFLCLELVTHLSQGLYVQLCAPSKLYLIFSD